MRATVVASSGRMRTMRLKLLSTIVCACDLSALVFGVVIWGLALLSGKMAAVPSSYRMMRKLAPCRSSRGVLGGMPLVLAARQSSDALGG